jgi:phosphohistidine swiveling domain-containing protein
MAHEVVFLKDERDDYRRLGSFRARPLMAEIGRRLGLSIKEAASMSIEETRQALRGGSLLSINELRARAKGYVILFRNQHPWLFASAQKARKVLRRELGDVRQRGSTEVRGLVGSAGTARGRVVIVHTKHDLRRLKIGDIMVSVTTSPDYVPAMRKCVAIVTDEGGITSHAAIVCRELRMPCIVGTGQGTKVFRDGDRAEVDANKGVVRKL